jgi:hypothetical protein
MRGRPRRKQKATFEGRNKTFFFISSSELARGLKKTKLKREGSRKSL